MRLADAAAAAARVAVVSNKCELALSEALKKWFSINFVKGAKLPLLRSVYQAGAYPAFAQILENLSDEDRAIIIAKLDKHSVGIQMASKREILHHIECLASGTLQPSTKPKPAKKAKPPAKKVSVIEGSKY